MSASAQQLAEELQIFGLDCEEALIEKFSEQKIIESQA
ncbi:POLA2 isoform 5 [Pan troglodytes]|uniref:DNA polymerase alpha 2, accessory subunit n=3 Tax=Hominidae TaxID=9604 RepID=E9PQ99_HUMAN|nr:POLA2 isoform 5 [Pan troglodytes]